MNEKFYLLTRNLLLSIAFSCIIYVYYGNACKTTIYSIRADTENKKEVSKFMFDALLKNGSERIETIKETLFNKDEALRASLLCFGVSFLALSALSMFVSSSKLISNTDFNLFDKFRRRNI